MNTVIRGHVANNQIVIDTQNIALPEGARVRITVLNPPPSREVSGLCGIWEDDRTAEDIAGELRAARSAGRDVEL